MATHVGMLSQGELVFQGTLGELEKMRDSCLRIGVSDVDSAKALLSSLGWQVQQTNEHLSVFGAVTAAAINRTLVEAGFSVHHLAVESDSLEELFLKMTRSEVV